MAEWFFVPGNHSSGLLNNLMMDYPKSTEKKTTFNISG